MDWLAWVGAGGLAGLIAVVLAALRYRRETRADPLIQWRFQTADVEKEMPGYVTVSWRPVGGDVRDVRIAVGGFDGANVADPILLAVWETDSVLNLPLPIEGVEGDVWCEIAYRPAHSPREFLSTWIPLTGEGRATREHIRQETRSLFGRAWLAMTRRAQLGPGRYGVPKQRVTESVRRRYLRRFAAEGKF